MARAVADGSPGDFFVFRGMKGSADSLSALHMARVEEMPVAWHHVRIPGPPADFALTAREREHPDPTTRYGRRTIQTLSAGGDRLALVDKASPHALHDLMISGLATPPHPSPQDVTAMVGQALWKTASSFVRFVSQPSVQRAFGLEGGRLHLALNCDPHTLDRESCQANKQFHLHLLYWARSELDALARPERVGGIADPRLRRQALDPLTFLGAHLIHECLEDVPLRACGASLAPFCEHDAVAGRAPLGCLIHLPGWDLLDDPAFEVLVRDIHRRIEAAATDILAAFTGRRKPPAPWHRHQLLPPGEIRANLDRFPCSEQVRAGLGLLALHLRDLTPALSARLRREPAGLRRHHMTLNQPCYSLNLQAPFAGSTARPIDKAGNVWLTIQTKIFSGIGGAGLLSLEGIPSVRIVRGEGTFSPEQWHHRALFQRDFALYNGSRLSRVPGIRLDPIRRFADTARGWMDDASAPGKAD